MTRVSLKVSGVNKLRQNLERMGIDADKEIDEIVNATSLDVQRTIVRSIQKGPATGRVYEKYTPRRTHQASAPGQPPMTDTGALASSIEYTMRLGEGIVFSRLEYAPYLEFGTQNMRARPYFTPAVEQNRPRFIKRFDKLIDRITPGVR